jgi:mRNA-degrading endonuclease RelE of RelBE toxin-antitoxin system
MQYSIELTPEAARQVRAIRATDRVRILDQCRRVLAVHPTQIGRAKIKRLRETVFPPFRLRVADFRVFYDVDEASRRVIIYGIVSKSDAMSWLSEQTREDVDETDDAR